MMKEFRNSNFSIMARMATLDPALMDMALVVVVQDLAFRVRAIKVVLINSLTKETSSSSLVIRVFQSS